MVDMAVACEPHVDWVECVKRDGYVVIQNCLPRDFIRGLHAEFMQVMGEKVRRFGLSAVRPTDGRDVKNDGRQIDFRPEGGNHDLNRWNMHLPSTSSFLDERLIAHPSVLSVMDAFLGPDCAAFLLGSDTPYPGAGFQSVHQDFHRFGFTVNIPLVDSTLEMGPLEVWPGSHLSKSARARGEFNTDRFWLSKKEIEEVVSTIPAKKLDLRAGSMVIRDHRLVHRGTANKSHEPRPWLSIWYKEIEGFQPADLTIPIPHRSISDALAKSALRMRRRGKGGGAHVSNRALLNLGNLYGRVVEEMSGSDRDERRAIPRDVWNTFSPRMKHLLRYASVESSNPTEQSWIGSSILCAASLGIMGAGLYLDVRSKLRRGGSNG